MKPVFVIMVTYRRFDCFKLTIESLIPTLPAGSQIAIVYNSEGRSTDDFQYDGYFRKLTAQYDFIEVLYTGTNEGWASSINEGLHLYDQWKDFEYVLETNNDVLYNDKSWAMTAQACMEKYPKIGIFGLWSHPHHSVLENKGDLVVKDNMPATAWLFRSTDLEALLPFKERGACKTRGGNGEDTDVVLKVQEKGQWVVCLPHDLATHIDGYDLSGLGKPNEAYA